MNDHCNVPIVQDGHLYCLQSDPTKSKDAQETASVPKVKKDLRRHFDGVPQSVSGPAMDA